MAPYNNPPIYYQAVARYAQICLLACAPLVTALHLDAATINWGTPQTTSTAATDVETEGTLIYAIDASNGGDGSSSVNVTGKNGVDVEFLSYGASDAESIAGFSSKFRNNANFGGGSSDYGSIADDGFWQGGESIDGETAAFSTDSVVLSDLVIGREYLIQYWAQDAGRNPAFVTILDGATSLILDTDDTTYPDSGQFLVGTFTANATTQSISVAGSLNGSNNWGRAQLNAIQLRAINNAVIGWQVEAESYTSQSGTQLETTSDTGDGQNVAFISNNNWLRFDDILLGDNALLNFRVARNTGTDDGHIEVRQGSTTGTLLAQIDVPETGGWQNWETISIQAAPVSEPEDIYLVFVETNTTNDGTLFNLNWWSKTPMVEAEDYTAATGQRFETTQDIGGGQNLGWISNDEWIEYDIEPQVSGWHKFDFRVASDNSDGSINIVLGGQTLGTIDIDTTGGWQTWETVSTYIELPAAGAQTLRLEFIIPNNGFNLNWFSYESEEPPTPLPLIIGNAQQQQMRYGMDYERLWFWYGSNSELRNVARWSAVDTDIDFIRVAMNSKYELTEGTYDLSAYTSKIIPMMQKMQDANPNIKFYASPRPLNEAVSGASWQPYPLWVTGATTYTSGDYDFQDIKCAEYIIKYLLLMKSYGFKISFLDVTNEWQSNGGGGRLTQDDMDDIENYLNVTYMAAPWAHPALSPTLLLEPEDIPEIIAPSSWSYSEGTSWIANLDSGDRAAISIAASHNTSRNGSAESFANAVINEFSGTGLDTPEIWNTELHGWKSTSNENETTSFFYYLETIRAGFGGINGWLAIGQTGQGHAYILNQGNGPTRNVKYHIYQKLSSTSNYGHALNIIDEPAEGVLADLSNEYDSERNVAAFIKGNLMTVWVINENTDSVPVEIAPSGYTIATSSVRQTRWTDPNNVEGFETIIQIASNTSFTATIPGESVVCFEITLNTETFANQTYNAKDFSHSWGIYIEENANENVAGIDNGYWTRYGSVAIDEDSTIAFGVARPGGRPDGIIRVREGSADGNILGEVGVPETGNWQNYQTIQTQLDVEAGIYNLYLEFVEDAEAPTGNAMFNLDWFEVNKLVTTSAPTGLTATVSGTTQIDLAWDAVPEATSYRVLRSTSEGGSYTEIENGLTTTSTSDDTASVGVRYFYVVKAVNTTGESEDSNVATATIQLMAPASLTATANGPIQIDLAWNAVSGATSYRILRATNSSGPYTEIENGLATTSTSDDTVSVGVPYYYVVRAVSGAGESTDSNIATATPQLDAPTNLTATANGNIQIDLAWDAVSEATSYRVLRATSSSGPYTEIENGLAMTSTSDETASVGVPYYYVVRAINTAVESADSNIANTTLPLDQPTGLTAISISFSQIDLNWNPIIGATSYTVERSSIRSRGPYDVIATGLVSPSHSDTTGLTLGTLYYYRVSGSNGVVSSPKSNIITVVAVDPIVIEDITMDSMSADLTNNAFSFSLHNSVIGHLYQAEKCEDLTIGDWMEEGAAKPGTGGTLYFDIPFLETSLGYFYRVNITHQE